MFGNNTKQVPTWLILSFLLFSLIGFIDAGYLTVAHYQHVSPTCSIVAGCDVVTTSKYSEIFGIPVALLGTLYYLTIFILSLIYFDIRAYWVKKWMPYVTIVGLVASAYFVTIQLFILKSICLYCLASAATSTILFILGLKLLTYKK